ncbi:cytochrome P450 [Gloeophyllum trabeum ATCC 11539]|uniref:Cytochrome P450 n=1 Tax=Gloeophyllum trabeum (strain ATCC 11539 / FP-39264 / Madison 617) TaxID=670483 RepID=S7PQH2_GLOTA|nr:cytochrome P450 [Gloeophyllum trabeum ATCC 11539]EPQ50056.1 cytochrome P450 [Gloeophyllum trabeum ATCC 11539]
MFIATGIYLVVIFLLAYCVRRHRRLRAANPLSLPYPPGPKPWPFFGNYFQIPSKTPWHLYGQWGKQYGDLVHIRIFNEHIIIVNSGAVARDLLEKRSNIYSDRPLFRGMHMVGATFNFGFVKYGPYWRRERRLFQQVFRADHVAEYAPRTMRAAVNMLRQLLDRKEEFMSCIRRCGDVPSLSMQLYGYDIPEVYDHFVELVEHSASLMCGYGFPGSAIVDHFPAVEYLPSWLPGMGFKTDACVARALFKQIQELPFEHVKSLIEQGNAPASFTNDLMNRMSFDDTDSREEAIKRVSGTGYFAGADTTTSAISNFFLAMALNPAAQERAQKEIDTVVGAGRLPSFDDRASLPYVEAVFREVLRWRAVVPLGVSHANTEDDIYDGFFIPKAKHANPILITPRRAMHMDERVYVDPESFEPERFLNPDGSIKNDFPQTAFGMGRRVCAGQHAANLSVWAAVASVLAGFTITKALNADGTVVEVSLEYQTGMTSHPVPFKCSITPRNSVAERLIRQSKVDSSTK